jgi:two-component system, OmpR family, response regulator
MKLLLVEDDRSIGRFLRRGLEAEGHAMDWAQDGQGAIESAAVIEYDAVILDLMLPDIEGIQVCRRLRQARPSLPILILSARDHVVDRIRGLNAGADDFLVKPFVFEELLARLAAIRRRSAPRNEGASFVVGPIVVDRETRIARRPGRIVELTPREFQLLDYLAKNHDRVVSRAAILSQVWGADSDVSDNTVDVYVGYLRKKLELETHLTTVRSVGFRLSLDA